MQPITRSIGGVSLSAWRCAPLLHLLKISSLSPSSIIFSSILQFDRNIVYYIYTRAKKFTVKPLTDRKLTLFVAHVASRHMFFLPYQINHGRLRGACRGQLFSECVGSVDGVWVGFQDSGYARSLDIESSYLRNLLLDGLLSGARRATRACTCSHSVSTGTRPTKTSMCKRV